MLSLDMTTPWGERAEAGASAAAARLGVPDFVYGPAEVRKGTATREVSDGILAVGNRGLILQVKAREPGADPERLPAWVTKQTKKALGQAKGTRRTLGQSKVDMMSLRGHTRAIGMMPQPWPAVILLDLPADQSVEATSLVGQTDLRMTLDDWYELNNQVRSTAAVIRYVERVLSDEVDVGLGNERLRYDAMAAADADVALRDGIDGELPQVPNSDEDLLFCDLVDEWIERHLSRIYDQDPATALLAVAALDSIYYEGRVRLGQKIAALAQRSAQLNRWCSSTFIPTPGTARVLVVCDQLANYRNESLFETMALGYALVRHEEMHPGDERPTLLLGRLSHDVGVSSTAAFLDGNVSSQLDPKIRWAVKSEHGCHRDHVTGWANDLFMAHEPCPCGDQHSLTDCSFDWS